MKSSHPQKNEIGRPLSFPKKALINDVTELFWTHGYKNLSLNIISQKTGLKRSSLYNTFKSKEALFSECLKNYSSNSPSKCLESYQPGQNVGHMLFNMFKQICIARSKDKQHRGCLVANTFSEIFTSDTELGQTLRTKNELQQKNMTHIIVNAIKQNELPVDTNAEIIANIIISFMIGLNMHSKKGGSKKELQKMSVVFLEKIGFCVDNDKQIT